MANGYLLGIDVGTTNTKSLLFDTEGHLVSSASQEYPIIREKPGWAEHDPEDWWRAVITTAKTVLRDIDPKEVLGAGVTSLDDCFVPLDKQGNPLYNCILWQDTRSAPQGKWITAQVGARRLYEITGHRGGGSCAAQALWLKENLPKVYGKTRMFLQPNGYITYKLTGEFTTDWTIGNHSQLMDLRKRAWSTELMEIEGLSPSQWPEIYSPAEVIGEITEVAARATGLAKGMPVIAGGSDEEVAAVGTGVVKPRSRCYCVAGTIELSYTYSEELHLEKQVGCRVHPKKDGWLVGGGVFMTGQTQRWFKDTFGQEEVDAGKRIGVSPYQVMDLEAESTGAGPSGIIFLSFPNAILGLRYDHRKGDIIRAILEGSAYGTRYLIELVEKTLGKGVDEVMVSGGAAKSRIWRQIKADITGRTVLLPEVTEATGFGVAILAGVGARVYKDIDIAEELVHVTEKTPPKQEFREKIDKLYAVYEEIRGKSDLLRAISAV